MASRVLMTKPNVFHYEQIGIRNLVQSSGRAKSCSCRYPSGAAPTLQHEFAICLTALGRKCHWGGKLDINLYRDDWTKLSGKAT